MTPLAIPENDKTRLITLQILRAGLYVPTPKHPEATQPYALVELVPVGLADDLVQTTDAFEAAYAGLARAAEARTQHAVRAGRAFTRLALCVRGIWAAMQRRARDPDISPHEAGLYRVPPPADRRMKGPRGDWLPTAQSLARHLDDLAAAGAWLPAEPSRADLQLRLEAAQAADDTTHRALAACKSTQHTMQQARRDAVSLYRGLAGCVRMGLRKLPAGARRDIMRNMGFRFHPAREMAAAPESPAPAAAAETRPEHAAAARQKHPAPATRAEVPPAAAPARVGTEAPAPRRGRPARTARAVARPRRARARTASPTRGAKPVGRAVRAARKRTRSGRRRRAPSREAV